MPKNNGKTRHQERREEALDREIYYDTITCKACGGRHHRDWNCIMQVKLINPPDWNSPEERLLAAIFGK